MEVSVVYMAMCVHVLVAVVSLIDIGAGLLFLMLRANLDAWSVCELL